jgi:hypothetical protein
MYTITKSFLLVTGNRIRTVVDCIRVLGIIILLNHPSTIMSFLDSRQGGTGKEAEEDAREEFKKLMAIDVFSEEDGGGRVEFQQKQERFQQIIETYPQFARETWGYSFYPLHQVAACSSSLSTVNAVMHAYPEAVEFTLAGDWTALHLACRYNQSEKVIQWLLEKHPEAVKLMTKDGSTPLHLACENNQSEQVIQWLLDKYPDAVTLKSEGGWTSLHLA